MSSNNKNDEEFKIGKKAETLIAYTFDVTTNRKKYPVKFRRLVDRMQLYALDIFDYVMDANECDIYTELPERRRLQTKAINTCNRIMVLINYCLSKNLISAATCEEWTEHVCNVKYMTISWRTREKR